MHISFKIHFMIILSVLDFIFLFLSLYNLSLSKNFMFKYVISLFYNINSKINKQFYKKK